MSALWQLRLMVVGATIGAIGGSFVLRPSGDLRPVAIAATAGAILLVLTVVVQRFASQGVSRLAPEYSSLIGRVVVTLGAALIVVLAFDLLVLSDARGVPARPNAQATVAPARNSHSQIPSPIAPASSVAPIVPASPQTSVRPPAPTPAASSAPGATVVPVSSPAAASSVSPPATPEAPPPATRPAPPPSPPPSAPATASPALSFPPATPQPTATPAPTSIIPTLPPLPTIRLP